MFRKLLILLLAVSAAWPAAADPRQAVQREWARQQQETSGRMFSPWVAGEEHSSRRTQVNQGVRQPAAANSGWSVQPALQTIKAGGQTHSDAQTFPIEDRQHGLDLRPEKLPTLRLSGSLKRGWPDWRR